MFRSHAGSTSPRRDRSLLRYLKCNAIGDYGTGTLKLSKGLAEILKPPALHAHR